MLAKQKAAEVNIVIEEKNIELTYYITSKEAIGGGTLYGICVEKYDASGGGKLMIDSDTVEGVSYMYDEVKFVIGKLISGAVTPVGMRAVIDDITGDTAVS